MARIELSDAAKLDLEQIERDLVGFGTTALLRYQEHFLDAFDLLSRLPLAGHERGDIETPAIRAWVVDPYVVLYDFNGDMVSVVRIVHGARDFRSLFSAKRGSSS